MHIAFVILSTHVYSVLRLKSSSSMERFISDIEVSSEDGELISSASLNTPTIVLGSTNRTSEPFPDFCASMNNICSIRANKLFATYIGRFCGCTYSSWKSAKKVILSRVPEYLHYFPRLLRENFNLCFYIRSGDIHPRKRVFKQFVGNKILCKRFR